MAPHVRASHLGRRRGDLGSRRQDAAAGVAACFRFPQTPADRAPHFYGDRAEPHRGGTILLDPRLRGAVQWQHAVGARVTDYFVVMGTGMPGTLTLTAPRWL